MKIIVHNSKLVRIEVDLTLFTLTLISRRNGWPALNPPTAGATYSSGIVRLSLIRASDLEPFTWTDSNFRPYHLTQKQPASRASH